MKRNKKILLITIILILGIITLIITRGIGNKENPSQSKIINIIGEFIPADPSEYNDFTHYTDKTARLSLKHPTDWDLTTKESCLDYAPWDHYCILITKSEYQFMLINYKRAAFGTGLVDEQLKDNSKKFKVDSHLLIRPNFINTSEETPEMIINILSVTNAYPEIESNQYNQLFGEVSNEIKIKDEAFVIIYSAPRNEIIVDIDIEDSEYIKTMDLILQSIDWNTTD